MNIFGATKTKICLTLIRSDNSMDDNNILVNIQEAVRTALCEEANKEIEKLRHKFECEMGKIKSEMIGRIVNQIEITTNHNPIIGECTVQINIKK